jgi:hypothetical protein
MKDLNLILVDPKAELCAAFQERFSGLPNVRVVQHNTRSARSITIVACPGLGTATGRVPFREAARQMALAYEHFVKPPIYLEWGLARQRQDEVRYGGDLGFMLSPDTGP